MADNYDPALDDLIARTRRAALEVSLLSVETKITFTLGDIVEVVERGLPDDYPITVVGGLTMRDLITHLLDDLVNGDRSKEE